MRERDSVKKGRGKVANRRKETGGEGEREGTREEGRGTPKGKGERGMERT